MALRRTWLWLCWSKCVSAVNVCDPRECACYSSSRRLEPWWPWELRLLKFFIIIISFLFISNSFQGQACSWPLSLVPVSYDRLINILNEVLAVREKHCGFVFVLISQLSFSLNLSCVQVARTYVFLWSFFFTSCFLRLTIWCPWRIEWVVWRPLRVKTTLCWDRKQLRG